VSVFVETIKLDDQVSAPAAKAAGAVDGLEKKVETAGKTMGKTGSASSEVGATMKSLGVNTLASANAMTIGKETISAAFTGISEAAKSLAAGDVKGAVQGLTDSVASMAKLLDLAVPGLGQAAAAVIQIAGGLVGITAGLIQSGAAFAIESTIAKQQMLAMFDALGAGAISGEQVDDMLDGLSAKLGVTKDAMVPLVQKFAAMGITSQEALEKMTTAALSAKALVGGAQSGADAFEKLSKKIQLASQTGQGLKIPLKGLGSLADMGLTVDDVAKKMGISAGDLANQLKAGSADASKFGDALQSALTEKGAGALETMSLSTANLSAMFHQYIGDMFEDMADSVKPFLQEVKSLFAVFDSKTNPSGQALKTGIGGFFKEVFAQATKVVPLVKHFLLDVIIYGLKAYLAVKPIVKAIKEFVESAAGASMISTILDSVWQVLKVIGVAVLVVVAAAIVLWAAMIAVSTAVWTAVGAVLGFVNDAGAALTGWVASAATAAYDFVAGLVSGIANGASQVIGAVTGLAGKATGAFKSALGIASPSKVMATMGGHMTDGVAEGLDAGASDVQAASSGVAGASVKGMSQGAGGAPGGSPGGGGAQISVTVLIDGAGKSAQEITEEMVAAVFQRMALGAGV
jgi:hypothetical protein